MEEQKQLEIVDYLNDILYAVEEIVERIFDEEEVVFFHPVDYDD